MKEGEFGIKLAEIGPWKLDGDTWEWDYLPMPTQRCDLCQDRIDAGKVPACVHHCQSLAMEFGPIEGACPRRSPSLAWCCFRSGRRMFPAASLGGGAAGIRLCMKRGFQ